MGSISKSIINMSGWDLRLDCWIRSPKDTDERVTVACCMQVEEWGKARYREEYYGKGGYKIGSTTGNKVRSTGKYSGERVTMWAETECSWMIKVLSKYTYIVHLFNRHGWFTMATYRSMTHKTRNNVGFQRRVGIALLWMPLHHIALERNDERTHSPKWKWTLYIIHISGQI